jgi:hypothetical protein
MTTLASLALELRLAKDTILEIFGVDDTKGDIDKVCGFELENGMQR